MRKLLLLLLLATAWANAANKIIVVPSAEASEARQILIDLSDSDGQLLYKGVPIQSGGGSGSIRVTVPAGADVDGDALALRVRVYGDQARTTLLQSIDTDVDNSLVTVQAGDAIVAWSAAGLATYETQATVKIPVAWGLVSGTSYYLAIALDDGNTDSGDLVWSVGEKSW